MQMDIREGMPLEEQLRILLDKMDVANTMPRGGRIFCLWSQISLGVLGKDIGPQQPMEVVRGHVIDQVVRFGDLASDPIACSIDNYISTGLSGTDSFIYR